MSDTKICPIINYKCLEGQCAWYDPNKEVCSIRHVVKK